MYEFMFFSFVRSSSATRNFLWEGGVQYYIIKNLNINNHIKNTCTFYTFCCTNNKI